MAGPSPAPVRYPSGVSTDFPWGPLADLGEPHPVKYHCWADDFDIVSASYTATKTGNGTIAAAAGQGGLALFTTNSSTPAAGDLASLQLPAAGFVPTRGKKAFFLVRLKVSSAANAEFNIGLIQTTTTPFTVTDGIYFRKPTGAATGLVCNIDAGSANVSSTVVPTAAYTLADATNIDLAFYINRSGDLLVYTGTDLVGWTFENSAAPVSPCARAAFSSFPTANLNFTLALKSGTASSKTMTVDFAMAAIER